MSGNLTYRLVSLTDIFLIALVIVVVVIASNHHDTDSIPVDSIFENIGLSFCLHVTFRSLE